VVVDPRKLSDRELQQLSRRFIDQLSSVIGPNVDIPAPDVNTNEQIMAWFTDEYARTHKEMVHLEAAFTGKPMSFGGSRGRKAATGRGGLDVLLAYFEEQGKAVSNLSVAVQGFGNVGSHFARLAHEAGFKVVAISDVSGAIYNGAGLDIPSIATAFEKGGKLDSNVCYSKVGVKSVGHGEGGCKTITNEDLLKLPVDVLVPAALENQIRHDNADDIQAKIVLELANGPTTPEADFVLEEKGVTVIPDILANAGGVTVSYYEWTQNRQNLYWDEEEVNEKLKKKMYRATREVLGLHKEKGISLRQAAYQLALGRLEEAMLLRGWIKPRVKDKIGCVNGCSI
jgi:glutamate dehydrogenase/leucine dehydrogenase